MPIEGEAEVNDAYSFRCVFRISLHLGQLVVDTTFTSNELDVATMRNFVVEQSQHLTGLIGYKFGGVFDVDIISASKQDTNEWHIFGNEWSCLKRQQGQSSIDGEVARIILEDHACNLVLSDFQRALREDTGFYCYRAIEVMMQSERAQKSTDSDAWKNLRSLLNFNKEFATRIKHFADPVRHGKAKGMSGQEREEIIMSTDQLIGRFLDFVIGGRKPLDQNKYPMLSGKPQEDP